MWIENTLFGFKMGNVNGKWLWLCWKYVKNGWVTSIFLHELMQILNIYLVVLISFHLVHWYRY
jgi:hypothetical protein